MLLDTKESKHIEEIISLAERCKNIENSRLIFTPFKRENYTKNFGRSILPEEVNLNFKFVANMIYNESINNHIFLIK